MLDSHERPILLQWATGTQFRLADDVRKEVGAAVGGVHVPPDAYVAMDYTLDWLYAAVRWYLDARLNLDPQFKSAPVLWPNGMALSASMEDIDLVVAWEDQRPHLLLVEAKGFTGWTNKQLASKASRLA